MLEANGNLMSKIDIIDIIGLYYSLTMVLFFSPKND